MTETLKQIARIKRIELAKDHHWKEVHKLETQLNAKIKKDINEEKIILERCKKVLYKRIENSHTCKCCSAKYPDMLHLTDEGKLFCRYDANHPNDIIDFEYNIDELLSEEVNDE